MNAAVLLPLRRAARRSAPLLVLAVLAGAAPRAAADVAPAPSAAPIESAPPAELVAEALFLCDTLPAGSRDVNVSVGLADGEPDPETGRTSLVASPRVQLAMPLGERLGFTADVGITTEGDVELDTPGAALKLLLRDAGDGSRIGLSASLDFFGSTHSFDESEAGVGLGAIRAVGRVAFRAAASVASGVRSWSPHLHAGVSAAVALGARWRALAEVVADVRSGEVALATGPTVKLAIGEQTALMAGALFGVGADAASPTYMLQLTRSL